MQFHMNDKDIGDICGVVGFFDQKTLPVEDIAQKLEECDAKYLKHRDEILRECAQNMLASGVEEMTEQLAFQYFDVNDSGFIDKREFVKGLKRMNSNEQRMLYLGADKGEAFY